MSIALRAPRAVPAFSLAGLGLALGLALAPAANAQSISVRVDGLSQRAVHAALVHAATRVCRDTNFSPLAPVSEDACIEDTVAAASRQVAQVRGQTDIADARSTARPVAAAGRR